MATWIKLTEKMLKIIARCALKMEYDIEFDQNKITVLEANNDGTYILFEAEGHRYSFKSRYVPNEGIAFEKGALKKVA